MELTDERLSSGWFDADFETFFLVLTLLICVPPCDTFSSLSEHLFVYCDTLAMWMPFRGSTVEEGGNRWIGGEHGHLIDDNGFFVQHDGRTKSRVVHQFDRFGRPYVNLWLEKQEEWVRDPVPDSYKRKVRLLSRA